MKLNILPKIIFLSSLLWISSCQTDNRQITSDMIHFPPSGDEESAGDAPLMSVDTINYNFGSIAIGEKVVHSYHFVNTGKSPLLIAQVTPSCGCTTSKDWPQEPIAPGEDGKITIEFNSKGFPGKIDKSISGLTNGIPKVIDLKLSGEVLGVESSEKPVREIEMEMQTK